TNLVWPPVSGSINDAVDLRIGVDSSERAPTNEDYRRRTFGATNLVWPPVSGSINDAVDLRIGVDSSERAPTNE
ncbi:hypothetical protein C7E25_24655, partial [Stenotrophomonas maltophilia]